MAMYRGNEVISKGNLSVDMPNSEKAARRYPAFEHAVFLKVKDAQRNGETAWKIYQSFKHKPQLLAGYNQTQRCKIGVPDVAWIMASTSWRDYQAKLIHLRTVLEEALDRKDKTKTEKPEQQTATIAKTIEKKDAEIESLKKRLDRMEVTAKERDDQIKQLLEEIKNQRPIQVTNPILPREDLPTTPNDFPFGTPPKVMRATSKLVDSDKKVYNMDNDNGTDEIPVDFS